MNRSAEFKLYEFPRSRNLGGYRARRSPGEPLQALTDILAREARLREQMGTPDEWLAELVSYASRGCVPA